MTDRNHRPSPLRQLLLAHLRDFYRYPDVVAMRMATPIVLAICLAAAFGQERVEPLPVVIAAAPGDAAAAAIVEHLSTQDGVEVEYRSLEEARAELRAGRALVLIEPGKPGEPRVYHYDPDVPESRLARALVDDALQRAEGRQDPTIVRDRTQAATGMRFIDFLVPGLLGASLMSSAMLAVGQVIVEMRMRKLIKRFAATPLRRLDFLIAPVIVRGAITFFDAPFYLVCAYLAFDVGVEGSLLLLLATCCLVTLTFSMLGLLLGARAANGYTATNMISLVMFPMFLGSGVFFSTTRFPDHVQQIVSVFPLTAAIEALRGIMLEGAQLADVAGSLGILAVWAVLAGAAAIALFRWQ